MAPTPGHASIVSAALADMQMADSPIRPSWIRSGTPHARSGQCTTSRDGTTTTWLWECTSGIFDWHFEAEETVHILDGEVTVSANGFAPRMLRAGDTAVFQAGTWARWDVPIYVRKYAILRPHTPLAIRLLMRVHSRIAQHASARQSSQ